MKSQADRMDQPRAPGSGTDWQLVGELALPGERAAQPLIQAWLADVLTPLQLPGGLGQQVGQSAVEAAQRVRRPAAVSAVQRAWLRLWIPANGTHAAQAWGFFRIETVEAAAENEPSRERSIEFYIFPEGP